MMGRLLGKRALAWGALFGILPELLDGFVSTLPLVDTARELAWRRGPGHSLLGMALGSWGIAHGLEKLWKREKISKAQAGAFVFAVWWVHGFVDCCTVEGAAVLWPFLDKRVAFNFLNPIEILFTVPLVVTVIRLALLKEPVVKKSRSKKPAPPSKRRKIHLWGLGLAAGYALLAVGMKFAASAGFDADLARRGTKYQRRMESPTPFNFLLWRSVVDRGDELWAGYRSVLDSKSAPVRWTVYPKGGGALGKVQSMRETQTLARRCDGWWLARPHAKGAWLGDLRFPESRVWGSKKGMVDSRLKFSWIIDTTAKSDHLRTITLENAYSGDYLQRMGARITGNRETWEANPRLAAAGSLPEFLPVEE